MARNKYPEITEQRILDSAYKLFIEKGWENTTIQDIIDDLGDLSRGAFYHHFKSKEDIIDAVTSRFFTNDNPFEIVEKDCSYNGLNKLKKVLVLFLTNENNIELVRRLPSTVRNSPQLIAKQVDECKTVLAPYFQKLIEDGVNDGSVNVKYPKQIAEMFSYLITLWVSPKYVNTDETEFVNVIDAFSIVLMGIGLPLIDKDIKDLCIQVFRRIAKDQIDRGVINGIRMED